MQTLAQDLRFALRVLARSPSFTAVAVLTLAVGIGATTAIASVVYGLLLRSLPYREAGRVAVLHELHPQLGPIDVAYPDYLDWRAQSRAFARLAAYSFSGYKDSILDVGGQPEEVKATLVSADFFPLLGAAPRLGRGFLAGDDVPGHDRLVLLSDQLWRRRFQGDRGVIGRAVRLNGEVVTVTGVLPAGAQFPLDAELFLPLSRLSEDDRSNRRYHIVGVVGRLRPGVSFTAAQSEMSTIAGRLQQSYPATNRGLGIGVVPLPEQLVGHLRPAVLVLFGAVVLVLLIACANVANLLLVRAIGRERELALRTALGAGRGRLLRQLATESVVLCGLSALLGVALAAAAMPLLGLQVSRFAGPGLGGLAAPRLSLPVLLFAALLTVVTAIVFGVLPSLRRTRPDLSDSLRQGERGGTGRRGAARALLGAAEIALAVVLVAGATLLIRSFQNLLRIDPGFNTERVLSLRISLPDNVYSDNVATRRFFRQLLERVEQLPGVTAAATTSLRPLSVSHSLSRFLVAGVPPPAPGDYPVAQIRAVSPGYFHTLGISLVAGRAFAARDPDATLLPAIVNQAFADRYLKGRNPVASNVVMGVLSPQPTTFPVVGVAANTRDLAIEKEAEPEIYLPGQANDSTLLVRSRVDPLRLAPAIRGALLTLDRGQPIYEVASMDSVLADSLAQPRLVAVLLGMFAALALLLAALGIYGVLAYTVTQRRREIGVRMALGARRMDILRMILRYGGLLVLAGEASGVVGTLAGVPLLRSLLFQVQAVNLAAIAGSMGLLGLVALAATALPAWRAARVEPMGTLREE
jgi:predicted permease